MGTGAGHEQRPTIYCVSSGLTVGCLCVTRLLNGMGKLGLTWALVVHRLLLAGTRCCVCARSFAEVLAEKWMPLGPPMLSDKGRTLL